MNEKEIEINIVENSPINESIEERRNHLPLKGRIINVNEYWMMGKPKKVISLEEIKQEKQRKEDEQDAKEIKEAMLLANEVLDGMPKEIQHLLSLNAISKSYFSRVKAKDEQHELILLRFEEGTNFYEHPIEKIVSVRWKASSFIPVVGIEVKKTERKEILKQIRKLVGFVNLKTVRLFHDYSFVMI